MIYIILKLNTYRFPVEGWHEPRVLDDGHVVMDFISVKEDGAYLSVSRVILRGHGHGGHHDEEHIDIDAI